MKNKKLVTAIAATAIFSACKSGVTDGSGSNGACVVDYQEAMNEYYELITDANQENDPEETPRECNLPTPDPGANLTFKVELTNFSQAGEEKMREALRRARLVLNSSEFKQRVLNFKWNGKYQFNDNNGMTNQEVYETIMKGAETLLPEVDYEMDLDITLYYKPTSTVGYTYPDTTRIWVNSKFFNTYNYGQVAANAVHEWTHKLGFGHDFYNNSDRPYSVPYGIGGIINELVNDF